MCKERCEQSLLLVFYESPGREGHLRVHEEYLSRTPLTNGIHRHSTLTGHLRTHSAQGTELPVGPSHVMMWSLESLRMLTALH